MRTYATSDGCRMAFLREPARRSRTRRRAVCATTALPLPEVAIDPELVRGRGRVPAQPSPRHRAPQAKRREHGHPQGRADPGGASRWPSGPTPDGARSCAAANATTAASTTSSSPPPPSWWPIGNPTPHRPGSPTCRRCAPHARRGLRERLGDALGLPVVAAISQVRATEHQVTMHNSAQQSRNVSGAFEVVGALPDGPGTPRRRHRRLTVDTHRGGRRVAPSRLSRPSIPWPSPTPAVRELPATAPSAELGLALRGLRHGVVPPFVDDRLATEVELLAQELGLDASRQHVGDLGRRARGRRRQDRLRDHHARRQVHAGTGLQEPEPEPDLRQLGRDDHTHRARWPSPSPCSTGRARPAGACRSR